MNKNSSDFDYSARRRALFQKIDEAEVDGYYTDDLVNMRYLFGFRGTAGSALISEETCHIFLDGRYRLYGQQFSEDDLVVHQVESNRIEDLAEVMEKGEITRVQFERDRLSYKTFRQIVKKTDLKKRNYGDDWIADFRCQKQPAEVTRFRQAIDRTLDLFNLVDTWIEPGLTEKELHRIIRTELESRGEAQAFSPIVLFGERTAQPHSPPSRRVLVEGEAVLVDMGVKVDGYCSDLTRMFFCGETDPEVFDLYRLSKLASAKALEKLSPGVKVEEVVNAAHGFLKDQGHEDHLRHGLGHGVGLDIHEAPPLSGSNNQVLKSGMVVTLEPGIYIDGVGGGRIEHMALITTDGAEILDEPNQFMD